MTLRDKKTIVTTWRSEDHQVPTATAADQDLPQESNGVGYNCVMVTPSGDKASKAVFGEEPTELNPQDVEDVVLHPYLERHDLRVLEENETVELDDNLRALMFTNAHQEMRSKDLELAARLMKPPLPMSIVSAQIKNSWKPCKHQ